MTRLAMSSKQTLFVFDTVYTYFWRV